MTRKRGARRRLRLAERLRRDRRLRTDLVSLPLEGKVSPKVTDEVDAKRGRSPTAKSVEFVQTSLTPSADGYTSSPATRELPLKGKPCSPLRRRELVRNCAGRRRRRPLQPRTDLGRIRRDCIYAFRPADSIPRGCITLYSLIIHHYPPVSLRDSANPRRRRTPPAGCRPCRPR